MMLRAFNAAVSRPLTGARIETPRQLPLKRNFRSPPHGGADRNRDGPDAWPVSVVAPSRGRGSKHAFGGGIGPGAWSPPHGGADRNIMTDKFTLPNQCRPLTGARIETFPTVNHAPGWTSPPHGGADYQSKRDEICVSPPRFARVDPCDTRTRSVAISPSKQPETRRSRCRDEPAAPPHDRGHEIRSLSPQRRYADGGRPCREPCCIAQRFGV